MRSALRSVAILRAPCTILPSLPVFSSSSSSLISVLERRFSSIPPTVVEPQEELKFQETQQTPAQYPFQSRAIRAVSIVTKKNIRMGPRKLNDILRTIRGLSVKEALIQLSLHPSWKAKYVAAAVQNAAANGENNYGMDPSRLYVALAYVGKGEYGKKIDIKAKGRFGIRQIYRTHLFIHVREQPYLPNEKRIGTKGPTFSAIQGTLDRLKAAKDALKQQS